MYTIDVPDPPSPPGQNNASTHEPSSANNPRNSFQVEEEINWEEEIKFNPGKRRSIDEYHPTQRDMLLSSSVSFDL
jgi:hypothetical protein